MLPPHPYSSPLTRDASIEAMPQVAELPSTETKHEHAHNRSNQYQRIPFCRDPQARGRLCSGRRGMGQHVHVRHVRLEPRHQHSIRERLRERESESVSGACACEGDGSTSVGSGSVFSHHVFVMHRGGTRMRASFLLFFSFSHSLCCASESFIRSDSMPVFLSCKE